MTRLRYEKHRGVYSIPQIKVRRIQKMVFADFFSLFLLFFLHWTRTQITHADSVKL